MSALSIARQLPILFAPDLAQKVAMGFKTQTRRLIQSNVVNGRPCWPDETSDLAVLLASWILAGCVTLQESERREKEAACGTWASAISQASRFEGRTASDIVWDLKGWKELECGRGE